MTTLYDVLGVRPNADENAIKGAFRQLAKAYHPDLNAGDHRAARRFRQIVAAYDVLKDAERRSNYDSQLEIRLSRARHERRSTVRQWAIVIVASAAISSVVTMLFPNPFSGHGTNGSVGPDTAVLSADQSRSPPNGPVLPAAGEADAAAVVANERSLEGERLSLGTPQSPIPRSPEAGSLPVDSELRDAAAGDVETMRALSFAAQSRSEPVEPSRHSAGLDAFGSAANGGPAWPWRFRRLQHVVDRARMATNESNQEPERSASGPRTGVSRDWTTYRDDQFGFSLSYPAEVFTAKLARPDGLDRIFRSRDGRAQLVVMVRSRSGESISSYRHSIINKRYAAATFDYTPVRESWFVLSGTKGQEMFYERVSFACGGRAILGWQLTYRVAEREFYDRIVEQVHRKYRYRAGKLACGQSMFWRSGPKGRPRLSSRALRLTDMRHATSDARRGIPGTLRQQRHSHRDAHGHTGIRSGRGGPRKWAAVARPVIPKHSIVRISALVVSRIRR
jgi:hypothetical protein